MLDQLAGEFTADTYGALRGTPRLTGRTAADYIQVVDGALAALQAQSAAVTPDALARGRFAPALQGIGRLTPTPGTWDTDRTQFLAKVVDNIHGRFAEDEAQVAQFKDIVFSPDVQVILGAADEATQTPLIQAILGESDKWLPDDQSSAAGWLRMAKLSLLVQHAKSPAVKAEILAAIRAGQVAGVDLLNASDPDGLPPQGNRFCEFLNPVQSGLASNWALQLMGPEVQTAYAEYALGHIPASLSYPEIIDMVAVLASRVAGLSDLKQDISGILGGIELDEKNQEHQQLLDDIYRQVGPKGLTWPQIRNLFGRPAED
jgi:hypothetical protein